MNITLQTAVHGQYLKTHEALNTQGLIARQGTPQRQHRTHDKGSHDTNKENMVKREHMENGNKAMNAWTQNQNYT